MTLQELDILRTPQAKQYIERLLECDPTKIALDKNLPDARLIASQVKYLQRARTKLPALYEARCIIPSLAFEQSSSQTCAEFLDCEGKLCIDLTCGLGIDSMHLAKRFEKVIAIERDETLAEVERENFARLGIENIEVINCAAEEFLASFSAHADLIYADPDRRDDRGRKKVLLQECSPDIGTLLPRLLHMADRVAVKLSPMFDTVEALRIFGPEVKISALSEGGECKQLLVQCGRAITDTEFVAIRADKAQKICFGANDDSIQERIPFNPDKYKFLIVPDVSLSKIRCAEKYLADMSAYFYSENGYGFCTEAPATVFGRIMEIESIETFAPKTLKRRLREQGIKRANIMRRLFPLSAEQIAYRLGITQGGTRNLCFTRIDGQLYQIMLR